MAFKMTSEEMYDNDVVNSSKPVVMIFSAPWCHYCEALKPSLMELAEELDGKIDFVGINVDEDKKLGRKYKVFTIPSLILRNNGVDSDKLVNPPSKEDVKQWLVQEGVL